MDSLEVITVNNPLRRHDRSVTRRPTGETVEQIVASCAPDIKNVSFAVYVNGLHIQREFWNTCRPVGGDSIVIVPVICGDEGGDDKSIWYFVGIMALSMIVGPYIPGVVLASGGIVPIVAGLYGLGALVSELGKPNDKIKKEDESQIYRFDPATTQQQGLVRARFYGQNRLHGNIIAAHTAVSNWDAYTPPYQTETANILIALSEGPCEGIVSGTERINDQPIANFTDVTTEEKKGESNQTHVSFFDVTKVEYHPYIQVTNTGGAQTYLTPGDDYDKLEVQLELALGLYKRTESGISAHQLGYKIEIRPDGGSWSTLAETSFGLDGDPPRMRPRAANFTSDGSYTGGSPVTITRGTRYEIRVTKTTADAATEYEEYADALYIGVVREVQETSYRYPYSALVGIESIATEKLHGTIDYSCEHKGRHVRVYSGGWSIAYSNNPAWVLYDVLTQPVIKGPSGSYEVERYEGMDPARLNTSKFAELAAWCDEMIDDGAGGTEKRITFNGGFDAGTNVWEAAMRVCETARCLLVWDGYEITLAIDKAATPGQLFNVGNIAAGQFQRRFLGQAERVSEVEVVFRDAAQDYEQVHFTVYDENIPNLSNKATLELLGCTRETQAWRHGKYRLNQNRLIDDFVQFQADIDAIACMIGDVVYVQHDVPDWQEGGRVVSANANSITVDKAVTVSGTDSVLVRVYNPSSEDEVIEDHAVDSVSGKTITITDTWTVTPSKNDVFVFGPTTSYKKPYRVVGIKRDSDQRATVACCKYDSAVYDTDAETPELPIIDVQPPYSDQKKYVRRPADEQIKQKFPAPAANFPVSLNVPLQNIEFISLGSGKVGWTTGSITYKGETYEIAAESTGDTNKYIYWDSDDPETFLTTNELSEAVGPDKFVVCVNQGGTPRPIGLGELYWGDMVIAETLSALSAQLGDVNAGTLTGTILTGGIVRTANSGKRVVLDSDGIKLYYGGTAGIYGRDDNGGSDIVYGQEISGSIAGITKAANAKVTVTSHSFALGDLVKFEDVTGMEEINYSSYGSYGTITDADPDLDGNAFEVNIDSSGFDSYSVGGWANVGSGHVYGAGVLATINHPSQNVPFRIETEQEYADFHYFNRANTPTGAAEVGDECVALGIKYICTTAGTPGTWTKVGTQT